MGKIYELTTNGDGGYKKYYVKGISNDGQAQKLAKSVFGKYYWANGVSHYDDDPSKYGNDWRGAMSIATFRKQKRIWS